MPVDSLSLKIIASKLKEELLGSTFNKPFYLGKSCYGIPYVKETNKGVLIFCLDNQNPFVSYTKKHFEKVDDNSSFLYQFRNLIFNTTCKDVYQVKGERILVIKLLSKSDDIDSLNSNIDIVIELFKNKCNLYVINDSDSIIQLIYKQHIDIINDIYLAKNYQYYFPAPRGEITNDMNSIAEVRPYLPNMTYRYMEECCLQLPFKDVLNNLLNSNDLYINNDDILSYNFLNPNFIKLDVCELYQYFFEDQKSIARKERNKQLFTCIDRSIKFANRKLSNLKSDLDTNKEKLIYLQFGQKIYQYQDLIKKGDNLLEKDGFKIDLDPKLSFSKNAERYFKKYSKAKSAIPILESLIKDSEDEIEYLLKKKIEADDGTPRDVMELKSELLELGYLKVKPGRNTCFKVKKSREYEPHYIEYNGSKIGFGMNGLQNEYLTFKIAKKEDLFLHVLNHPGSHVLILDKEDDDSFLLACELALYLSHLDCGDIMYTCRKHVKKNPNKIGLVNLLEYETCHINKIREDSIELFNKVLKKSS